MQVPWNDFKETIEDKLKRWAAIDLARSLKARERFKRGIIKKYNIKRNELKKFLNTHPEIRSQLPKIHDDKFREKVMKNGKYSTLNEYYKDIKVNTI